MIKEVEDMKNQMNRNIEFLLENVLVKHKIEELIILTYGKNENIISETEPINDISFVVSGKIKVYKEFENGKTLLLQFVNGLSSMGDVEYINELKHATGSVKAVNDVYLFKISYEVIKERYTKSDEFNSYMIKHLSKRFLSSTSKSSINIIYPLETRLASYILSMNSDSDKNEVTIYNLQELSENLGTSYRHLHRSLKDLSTKKIILRNKNIIKIINNNKLEELSRGNIYEDSYNENEA